MFCLNMMRIALELAKENPVYEGLATKFFQHYVYVAAAMKHMGNRDYSALGRRATASSTTCCATPTAVPEVPRALAGRPDPAVRRRAAGAGWIEPFAEFRRNLDWFLTNRRDLVERRGPHGRSRATAIDARADHRRPTTQLGADPRARLGPGRVPFRLTASAACRRPTKRSRSSSTAQSVGYEPAEAVSKIKGGNSNWRGPIWFPTCFLLIESLRKLARPTGRHFRASRRQRRRDHHVPARWRSDFAERLISHLHPRRQRATPGLRRRAQVPGRPALARLHPFYEYFHGDNGAGLGASHQTGWTALVASLIDEWRI